MNLLFFALKCITLDVSYVLFQDSWSGVHAIDLTRLLLCVAATAVVVVVVVVVVDGCFPHRQMQMYTACAYEPDKMSASV